VSHYDNAKFQRLDLRVVDPEGSRVIRVIGVLGPVLGFTF
jgi:hypothetical protein